MSLCVYVCVCVQIVQKRSFVRSGIIAKTPQYYYAYGWMMEWSHSFSRMSAPNGNPNTAIC